MNPPNVNVSSEVKKEADVKNPTDVYSTSDLHMAVVLMERGHRLFDMDKKSIDPRRQGNRTQKHRIVFLFENTDQLRKDMCDYISGKCPVDAQALLSRLRSVRAMVNSVSSSGLSVSDEE